MGRDDVPESLLPEICISNTHAASLVHIVTSKLWMYLVVACVDANWPFALEAQKPKPKEDEKQNQLHR